ncbi:MAG: hypothetical protein NTV51_03450 [Verrucomicrobia bacterium]|nr:hypothetical protein [Verrucomicrobiota bacterium]
MPIPILMAVAAAGAAVAGLISSAIASGDEAKARQLREDFAAKYGEMHVPKLDALVAETLPPDAARRYSAATQSGKSMLAAQLGLQEIVDEQGETPEDAAAYARSRMEAAGQEASGRGAIARSLNARGLSGSGIEAALMASNAQAATNRLNTSGLEQAADARARRMAALQQLGSMGAQGRGLELQSMGAADAINQFNARQRTDTNKYNQSLKQQEYDNEMAKLSAQGNAMNGVANSYERGAQNTRNTGAAVGNAFMSAAGGAANFFARDEDPRKKRG